MQRSCVSLCASAMMAVMVAMSGGCERPSPQRRAEPTARASASQAGAMESAGAKLKSDATQPGEEGATASVICRDFTAMAEYELNPPGPTINMRAMLQLQVTGLEGRRIVAARIPAAKLCDARGRPYFNDAGDWGGQSPGRQMSETYALPLAHGRLEGKQWNGQVRMWFALLNRSVLDWPRLDGKLQLLEAAKVVSVDVQLGETGWQAIDKGLDIRVARLAEQDMTSRTAYGYFVRSRDGRMLKSLGGTPCVMGIAALANGRQIDNVVYDGAAMPLASGGHVGMWTVDKAAQSVRLFIVTQFKQHTLTFGWQDAEPKADGGTQTQQATLAKDATAIGDAGDLKLRVAFARVQFMTKMDAKTKRLERGVALIGMGGVENDSPVMCFDVRIRRVVDAEGKVYELPGSAGDFSPVCSSTGWFKPRTRCEFKRERMDLPVMVRQPVRVEGEIVAVVAGKVESRSFEKVEQGRVVELPGGGTLKLLNPLWRGPWWRCTLQYSGGTRPMMPGPGEPGILSVRVVDDRGQEMEPSSPLTLGNYQNQPGEYLTTDSPSFMLGTERRVAGLRVYYTPSAKEVCVPFVIDVNKPIAEDPWQKWW